MTKIESYLTKIVIFDQNRSEITKNLRSYVNLPSAVTKLNSDTGIKFTKSFGTGFGTGTGYQYPYWYQKVPIMASTE